MDLIGNIHNDLQKGALQLVAEHRAALLTEARRLGCNETDADDLVSRTLDKALRKIDSFSGEGSVSGWMKAILHNLRLNDQRRPVDRMTTPIDPQNMEAESAADWRTDEEILKNSDSEALKEAIDRLDPAYKQAVVMHYFGELPVKSIALALNLPMGTVLWRLRIARKMLAKDLAAKFGKKNVVVLAVLLALGTLWAAWQMGFGTWLKDDAEAFSVPQDILRHGLSSNAEEEAKITHPTTSANDRSAECLINETTSNQEEREMKFSTALKTAAVAVPTALLAASADTKNTCIIEGSTERSAASESVCVVDYEFEARPSTVSAGSGSDFNPFDARYFTRDVGPGMDMDVYVKPGMTIVIR